MLRVLLAVLCTLSISSQASDPGADPLPLCDSLLSFQFDCVEPPSPWPKKTVEGCLPNNTIFVNCSALDGVECIGDRTFQRQIPCRYTNGYSYSTALGLSVMLGNFGVDRFYLGYPIVGLIKLCTCGFFVIGNLIDITLIATQALGPADGSQLEVEEGLPVMSAWPVTCQTRVQITTLMNEEVVRLQQQQQQQQQQL